MAAMASRWLRREKAQAIMRNDYSRDVRVPRLCAIRAARRWDCIGPREIGAITEFFRRTLGALADTGGFSSVVRSNSLSARGEVVVIDAGISERSVGLCDLCNQSIVKATRFRAHATLTLKLLVRFRVQLAPLTGLWAGLESCSPPALRLSKLETRFIRLQKLAKFVGYLQKAHPLSQAEYFHNCFTVPSFSTRTQKDSYAFRI
jgi:hypothetical protein